MAFISLKLPPGVYRPGTIYDARGRWFDSNLVRWYENAMRPVGGWTLVQHGGGGVVLGEPVRGMVAWRANDEGLHMILGTPNRLYHFRVGGAEDTVEPGFANSLTVTGDVPS